MVAPLIPPPGAAACADIVLWLVDASAYPGAGDRAIANTLSRLPEEVKVILAMNKSDLLKADAVVQQVQPGGH